MAHMAPVLGDDPSVGSGPTVETKTPSRVAFIHRLFLPFFPPKPVSLSVQTELRQQLHTPDAPSIGLGTFCLPGGGGGNKRRAHVSAKPYTTMDFPPFLSPPQSCATSHPLALMVCEVPWTEPGNICFSLVFVNRLD